MEVAKRMHTEGFAGKVVTLTLKFAASFEESSKQESQPRYVWTQSDIYKVCIRLLDSLWPCEPVRLIRIRVNELAQLNEIKKD